MTGIIPTIRVPVDLTNPGQFFACCGLLELADRLWPGAEGWFDGDAFCVTATDGSLASAVQEIANCVVENTMTPNERHRLDELSALTKEERIDASEKEKKLLESLRRELPIVLSGKLRFLVDWFCDEFSGGSRFKTWAGQQSVLDIAAAMHAGLTATRSEGEISLWNLARGIGLPFNFDSDLGGQGSALDIGFSFDPLAGSKATRIETSCKPILEFLCFVGLQRFRPREEKGENRFVYTAWNTPLAPSVAAAVACQAIQLSGANSYEFRLLYRTKYLKSFLPAQLFQGDRDE
ncbi:MAG: type I-U CRISPR-associated protein Cas8c [Pirellulales bacterium]|nr:type I-U CRISPR-associated protein Cas8c [Pirellulales bacterium]